MSILTAWSPFFQSNARMRGRGYQASNRVERIEPQDGELVRATVQCDEQYIVTVIRDGTRAAAECTCSAFAEGTYCKHIWATLLDVQQNPEGIGASADELAAMRVRAPKARKRAAGESSTPARSSEPEWVGRLSLLRPATIELDHERAPSEVLPAQRQLCYVVLPDHSRRHNGLVVELRQRTPIATGWSKPKPMKVGHDTLHELADNNDRELCALLLGSLPFDEGATTYFSQRGHAMFRLPTGVWRNMLKRMIDTGRCFVAAHEDDEPIDPLPLRWDGDEPWVLWMIGQWDDEDESADADEDTSEGELDLDVEADDTDDADDVDSSTSRFGEVTAQVNGSATAESHAEASTLEAATPAELLVHVELRRDGKRMGVGKPALLLGGADGLIITGDTAAAFDDREAFRWASQFRDDLRRHESLRPIRVPRQDVDRFLDRLYMLPQLPELDLPDDVGRTPERIHPVPHLDLFSPESPEGNKLLPASAKNQLVGRVWFGYDDQRVSPAQPGRFVAINSAASSQAMGDTDVENTVAPMEASNESVDLLEPGDIPEDDAGGSVNGDVHAADASAEVALDAPPKGRLIHRHRRAEWQAMQTLVTYGLRPLPSAGPDIVAMSMKQMGPSVTALLANGWQVEADQQTIRHAGTPHLSIASGIDWFELRGGIRYQRNDGTEEQVTLPQILAAVRSGRQMITLGDGSQGLLPQAWLDEHGLLTTLGKVEKDHLRFGASQAAVLDALLTEDELVEVDETFDRARQRLHEFQGVKPLNPTPRFKGDLRPYQREGLGWFAFLRWFGMGGILADDMGLGKTIQVLAMLDARRKYEGEQSESSAADGTDAPAEHRPALVVAPRSVVFNWVDEAEKFTPHLRVEAYAGTEREALRDRFNEIDIVVTSFGLLRRDIEVLQDYEFDYIVLDEAQAIKNPGSQAAKAARLLRARHRLALTGTPVENHLGDLWSIFEFLNPGMLGSNARFNEMVRATNTAQNGNGREAIATRNATISQVGKMLRPFILRRTKKQVLHDLPEKTEQTIVCEMEPAQQQVYDDLRKYYRQHLLSNLETPGGSTSGSVMGGKSGFMVLEALLRLRQAACHPGLIDEKRADDPSAKLDALLEQLDDVIGEGSKALVFSQFTSMLSLVRRQLDARGIPYCYLDGQTRNRREVVRQFQEDETTPVFLISLKTGGFGLNLTAAEYVFILDPWWNPAVEQQAIDRTHRIGQTRRVFAYRMICQDTVEQRITQLQQQKREIAEAIVGGEQQVLRELTRDDLEQLLS
ncbi:SNF2-related protein [Phycisphaerales bacterium AB-hyl4]|uniref:SNF2-related protein n=1 Tax=Natronomicrosphaera hydrolytica TaxID=3242702 RepID=A0ABV4U9J1_9BACT